MLAVGLALIACLSWGISGFLAGTKSRVMPVLTLLVFSSMAGLGMFLFSVGVRGVPLPRDPNLLYAVLGGAGGVGGLYCLYRGLAEGAISIVVPVSALCVLLPVLTGLALGEVLHPHQVLGIMLAIGGAVDPLWAAMVSRLSFFLFLLPAVLLKRPSLKVKAIHLPVVFAIGILDSTAALAYTSATTKGMLSLVSVISSLYPAVSVILAALILKERLRGFQFFGDMIMEKSRHNMLGSAFSSRIYSLPEHATI
jgi:uncharacterized membrane protein